MGPGLLAPLNHANITTIHGLEEADGVRFIAMECVEGETLPERNARSGRVEVREALDGSAEAASVVDEGHARGLARRLPWVVAAASVLAVVAVPYWSPVAGGPPPAHRQFHLTFPKKAPLAPTGVIPLTLGRPALALSGDISARLFESRETVAVYGIGFHPRYVEPGFLPTADRVTLSSARFDPDELGGVGELEVVLDDLRTEIPMRPAAQYAVSAIGILASAPGTVGSEGRLVRSDPGSSDFERNAGGETRGALDGSATSPGILERDTLTGDWGGGRTWLKERGITLEPRLTQFYQGMTAGEGDKGFEYGGKADLLLRSDLGKLGLWDGLSLTVQAEYNFGQSVNEIGGTLLPVNTALLFPGTDGADAFDVSSFYFGQTVGDFFSMVLGKINMMDFGAERPFAGGAGIDAFWNIAFTAPPSGTVPPYLLGALLSFKTDPATFGLWIFDANSGE